MAEFQPFSSRDSPKHLDPGQFRQAVEAEDPASLNVWLAHRNIIDQHRFDRRAQPAYIEPTGIAQRTAIQRAAGAIG